jgi:hypothetical protein
MTGIPSLLGLKAEKLSKATAAYPVQWGSNAVSDGCLPKTAIFAVVAGDFCRIDLAFHEFGLQRPYAELQKPANGGPFCYTCGGSFSGIETILPFEKMPLKCRGKDMMRGDATRYAGWTMDVAKGTRRVSSIPFPRNESQPLHLDGVGTGMS